MPILLGLQKDERNGLAPVSQPFMFTSSNHHSARLGVAYFPEHWPPSRWETDAQLMAEAGLQTVRLAEFAWSRMQPGENRWNWDWLDQAIETLTAHGLDIILCTPTACPPPWMVEKWPDLLPYLTSGARKNLGARRHYSPFHEGYRQAARKVAEEMARRYGKHPRVIGFQIDNELGGGVEDCGSLARRAFAQWLREKHHTPEALNENLGLIFWGSEFTSWDQIPAPVEQGQHPGLKLEWRRFWSSSWIDFCRLQADAMRPFIGDRILTTNCFLHRWGMKIDWLRLLQDGGIDLLSFDNYSLTTDENAYYNTLARNLSPRYWILEQNCGDTTHHHRWPKRFPDPREIVRDSLQEGAELISFFRWRQGPFGLEQEHAAILDHHGRPGKVYRMIQDLSRSLKEHPPSPPSEESSVGIAYSWEQAWLLENASRSIAYSSLVQENFHAACLRANLRCRFLFAPPEDAPPFLLLPGHIGYDPDWEDFFMSYVKEGGTLISFPLFQARDQYNKYREEYLGSRMKALFGLDVERRILIEDEWKVSSARGEGFWHTRVEEILCQEATPLDTFHDGPIPGSPALTQHRIGSGRAIHCAGFPTAEALAGILKDLS